MNDTKGVYVRIAGLLCISCIEKERLVLIPVKNLPGYHMNNILYEMDFIDSVISELETDKEVKP